MMQEKRYKDLNQKQLKLSFIAPSGYGKTTAVEFMNRMYKSINLKLAEPLYEIQNYYYNILQVDIPGKQDGELLQFLGNKIQRDYPYFLADSFYKQLQQMSQKAYILTNDDCRPHNYIFLKEMGFLFVKIVGNCHEREDITPINHAHPIEWRTDIPYDFILENRGTIQEYENNIRKLVEIIAAEKRNEKMLCSSYGEDM